MEETNGFNTCCSLQCLKMSLNFISYYACNVPFCNQHAPSDPRLLRYHCVVVCYLQLRIASLQIHELLEPIKLRLTSKYQIVMQWIENHLITDTYRSNRRAFDDQTSIPFRGRFIETASQIINKKNINTGLLLKIVIPSKIIFLIKIKPNFT